MQTVTKFIIALCPATPIYLVKCDVPANRIFSRHAATVATKTTRVKAEALVFDTFEAAMEVAKDITGWGGAQRVEQVAVEVKPPADMIDIPNIDAILDRDDLTQDQTPLTPAQREVARARLRASVSALVKRHLCELASDALCEARETDPTPAPSPAPDLDARLSKETRATLARLGAKSCRTAWHYNVLRGEGPTVCAIEADIPETEVSSAIAAWAEVWSGNFA